jgi:hypothetical protein
VRITAVAGGVPDANSGGGALTAYTVIKQLIVFGHDVSVVPMHTADDGDPLGRTRDERIAALERLGATVVPLTLGVHNAASGRLRRIVAPTPRDAFAELAVAGAVARTVANTDPNAVFVYHFDALAATAQVETPRFAAVGDPTHLPTWYRWRETGSLASLPSTIMVMRSQRRAILQLLRQCARTGAFAAHHASWLRSHGVPDCEYLHTPVPWVPQSETLQARRSGVPRILLLGHLKGTVTQSGLRVFAEMLPLLESWWGRDGFEARIVGGYDVPADVRARLDHPAVVFAGHTDDPGNELRAADVFLVPNPIDLGIRVRIITAFAHGAAIVSHRANARGIPELHHEANALLGSSPAELARAVRAVVDQQQLAAAIRSGARETYEQWFAPAVAVGTIADRLAEIAR